MPQTSRTPRVSALLISALLLGPSAAHAAPPSALVDVRTLTVDAAAPAHARAGTAVSGTLDTVVLAGPEIAFALPDGRVLTAKRERLDDDPPRGRRSWVGTFTKHPGSLAVLTTFRGTTTGFLSFETETWELRPARTAGRHVLFRVDDARLPTGEDALRLDGAAGEPRQDAANVAEATDSAPVDAAGAGGYVHDLLVLYTPAARLAHGRATLESMIVNAVSAANQAYVNSRVAVTLNLVGLQEIAYSESGNVQTSLYDLRGPSDGKIDGVHALRNDVGADLVSLVTEDTSSCGMAWVMNNEASSFAAYAFSIVKTSCLSQHSLAHELGHNQGNEHDRDSSSYSGAFPYSYGFRRCVSDGTGFRTVMSYPCSGAARVAWFSNPNVTYNGHATGIAYESSPANSSDNARSMNNSADTVAAFRAAKAGSAPAAPSALTGTATSAGSVSLRWTDNASNETGFALQRSGNGVDFVDVARLGAGVTTHVDDGLQSGQRYYYRVRAFNGSGTSAFSNTLAVTTSSASTPTATLSGFVLARSTVAGCKAVTGKVTLTAPAPAGGFQIAVSDTLQNATTPASVTVPAGATTVSFAVRSTAVAAQQSGSVSVRAGTTLSQSLTLRPIGVQTVALARTSVTGGTGVDGTVRLECAAPQGHAVTATLSSTLPGVAKPAVGTLTFQPGVQTLGFTVGTSRVSSVSKPRIRATANGITRSAVLTVNP